MIPYRLSDETKNISLQSHSKILREIIFSFALFLVFRRIRLKRMIKQRSYLVSGCAISFQKRIREFWRKAPFVSAIVRGWSLLTHVTDSNFPPGKFFTFVSFKQFSFPDKVFHYTVQYPAENVVKINFVPL